MNKINNEKIKNEQDFEYIIHNKKLESSEEIATGRKYTTTRKI